MEITYKDHYDDNYFTGKKTYQDAQGNTHVYHGPALVWEGFDFIAAALAKLLPKGSLLDIGCSAGDLARRIMARGFDCYGIEISQYAIKNCVEELRGRIALADITETPEHMWGGPMNAEGWCSQLPKTFDTLIATDLLEHIYYEDLDKTFDWMLSKTNKWMFFCVATTTAESHKGEFVAKKGEPIPPEFEATAISGHVNVRSFKWWAKYFESKGLEIDWQRMYLFQMQREQHAGWRDTMGWNMMTTFFLRKP